MQKSSMESNLGVIIIFKCLRDKTMEQKPSPYKVGLGVFRVRKEKRKKKDVNRRGIMIQEKGKERREKLALVLFG